MAKVRTHTTTNYATTVHNTKPNPKPVTSQGTPKPRRNLANNGSHKCRDCGQ